MAALPKILCKSKSNKAKDGLPCKPTFALLDLFLHKIFGSAEFAQIVENYGGEDVPFHEFTK